MHRLIPVLLLAAACPLSAADEAPPRSLDPRLKIELFAEQPQLVTPTGIDVDHAGRVWVIESNTHFRPESYTGHASDRVLVMRDTDGDRRADKIVTFLDGLTHTMSVAVKPVWLSVSGQWSVVSGEEGDAGRAVASDPDSNGQLTTDTGPTQDVYIATRGAIFLCRDTDGDLRCDERQQIVRLETAGNYPHNGLAGFAFDPLGNLFFGFGENLGADYKIIGSDGTTLSGGGEGGNLYRCKLDGSKLERWATGFWNPHASCFDAFGRLFTVDNDADSRPPCRLLHIIPGGDYGYRFRNGRKGLHPFTSWNGEIPGTLPMVAGTGEAPSGIVAYESDGLPDDYLGTLLVTSWGDHRIDKFVLKPKGASFTSRAEPVIVGGENFRPVGIALAPDGSLYCSDWVLKDYNLHGHGRVWRISAVEEPAREVINVAALDASLAPQTEHRLASRRADVRRVSAHLLAQSGEGRKSLRDLLFSHNAGQRDRIESLWALLGVAVDTERLNLFSDKEEWDRLFVSLDDVAVEAARNLGSPQAAIPKEFDGATRTPMNAEPSAREQEVAVYLAEHFLRTHSLAGIGWIIAAGSKDPFLQTHARTRIERFGDLDATSRALEEKLLDQEFAGTLLLAIRNSSPGNVALVGRALQSQQPVVQRLAVQWIAELGFKDLRPQVEAVLDGPMTPDLFMATLAALEMLDGKPPQEFDKSPPVEHALRIVQDEKRSPELRSLALRMIPPSEPALDAVLLAGLLQSEQTELKLEAIRTLQHSPLDQRVELLRPIAANESLDEALRAEAISGLANRQRTAPPADNETSSLLVRLAASDDETMQLEALRSLRSSADNPAVRSALVAFRAATPVERSTLRDAITMALGDPPSSDHRPSSVDDPLLGDPAAGRRVFYHANSAGCYKCHTVNGRGGNVGPDLTVIARTMDRKKLAESILEPSREVAPQFTAWTFVMNDGKVHNGMILTHEPDGRLRIGTAEAETVLIDESAIEEREPQKTSLMPEKLIERLTTGEFQDLLAFLETLR